jgi:hypothetical protein
MEKETISSGRRDRHVTNDTPHDTPKGLGLNERLGLLALMDEEMRAASPPAPHGADLFDNLWDLVTITVSGSRINRLKPEDTQNGFRVFEISAEGGDILGRLNMLYLKKPIPCYYLVYVEVAAPFRRKGLGNRIIRHFGDFLASKSAVGILDNIIPEDEPTYDIYQKRDWRPIDSIVENAPTDPHENYMIFIPPALAGKEIKKPVLQLLHHLKRRRTVIDIRDNDSMVQRTLAEFKTLHQTLLAYFAAEISTGESSAFMRFMFTRFVTKFIAFRRRIGDLLGYTGGESTEQITLLPQIAALPIKSYAPREWAKETSIAFGDRALFARLSEALQAEPARLIEALPNYHRPSLTAWLQERGKSYSDTLTIGDLMDLGFDPTRLKEITIDGEAFIFERVQARQLSELQKKNDLLDRIASEMPLAKTRNASLKTNPIVLAIQDRGNAYVLRRKVHGIHWEEALEQLQSHPLLQEMNASTGIDRVVLATVREANAKIADHIGVEKGTILDQLATFVSWDLHNNQPRMIIDFGMYYLEAVWMA